MRKYKFLQAEKAFKKLFESKTLILRLETWLILQITPNCGIWPKKRTLIYTTCSHFGLNLFSINIPTFIAEWLLTTLIVPFLQKKRTKTFLKKSWYSQVLLLWTLKRLRHFFTVNFFQEIFSQRARVDVLFKAYNFEYKGSKVSRRRSHANLKVSENHICWLKYSPCRDRIKPQEMIREMISSR